MYDKIKFRKSYKFEKTDERGERMSPS